MPFPPSSHAVWIEVDTDGDGIVDSGYDDGTTPPSDTPPENPPPTGDSDGDGLSDADEAAAGSDPYNPDSDGDGLTDTDEINQTGSDPTTTDSDGDGISDYNEQYGNGSVDEDEDGPGETPYDHDGDGIPDPVDPDPTSPENDPDSDGDGVPDSQDSHPANPGVWNDANGNGINDDAENTSDDSDGDGVSNDTDSHPGDPSLFNDWNYNGVNDPDEDWDGDGVSNLQDSHPNSNVVWCDWNDNGINDDAEANLGDHDGDNVPNNADSHPFNSSLWEDWNGNGCNDSQESNDSDSDSVPDYLDSDPNDPNLWEDWNRNGINDSQEFANQDRDNDQIPNENDSDPDNGALWSDWNRNGTNDDQEQVSQDSDGDGHVDQNDSDPGNMYLWEDWNHNGLNDSAESNYLDSDGDTHPDTSDTHPSDPLLWNDHNGNGINDESEVVITDSDGDGYADELDTHPQDISLWNDHNNNGVNDELEAPPDSDGDGIADHEDSFPHDRDNDGLTDEDEIVAGTLINQADSDGDGLTDGEEAYAGTDPLNVDTDADGLTDYEELRAYFTDPLSFTPPLGTSDADPPSDEDGEENNTPGTAGNDAGGSGGTALPEPVLMIEQQLGANAGGSYFLQAGTTISFPSVSMKPDKSDQKSTLTLHNKGTAPLTGLSISIEGANKDKFTSTLLQVTTLAPGATTSLAVTFTGSKAAAAALHVLSDAPQTPVFVLPLRAIAGVWSPHKAYFFADMRDDDLDGIPNLVEELYAPLVVTPDGDLDGDGVTNLNQYLSGLHLIDSRGEKSGDFDGDGLSDVEEQAWGAKYGIYSNPYRFEDAFMDVDADGLLTIEELKPRWGGQADARACATNPFLYSTGPSNGASTSTYKLTARAAPPLVVAPKDAWKERMSTYFFWMPDGLLRLARRDFATMSDTEFYAPSYRYQLPLPTPNPTAINDGWDHLPNGYAMWLKWHGVTFPLIPGVAVGTHPVSGQLPVFPDPESRTKIFRALYLYLIPASSNIDADSMPNVWEASHSLDWRNKFDAGLSYDENNLVPEFAIKGPSEPVLSDPITPASLAAYNTAVSIWHPWYLMNLADPDHDGLPNWREHALGKNPRLADYAATGDRDSDGDKFTDAQELATGTNALLAASKPAYAIQVLSPQHESSGMSSSPLRKPLVIRTGLRGPQGGFFPLPAQPLSVSVTNNYTLLCTLPAGQIRPAASDWVPKSISNIVTDAQGQALIAVNLPWESGTLTLTLKSTSTRSDLNLKPVSTTHLLTVTPRLVDSDGDNVPDALDSDSDGMPDAWEIARKLDKDSTSSDDSIPSPMHYGYHRDTPHDRVPVTSTINAKTELAGLYEVPGILRAYNSAAKGTFTTTQWNILKSVDPDHDGLSNLDEYLQGNDPKVPDCTLTLNRDSDGDGFTDHEEFLYGSNLWSSASTPLSLIRGAPRLQIRGLASHEAFPGEMFPERFEVLVNRQVTLNGQSLGYDPLRDVSVTFTASPGCLLVNSAGVQSATPLTVKTNFLGIASVRMKAGPQAGPASLTAQMQGASTVSFNCTIKPAGGGGGGGIVAPNPTVPGAIPTLPTLGTVSRPFPQAAKIVAYTSSARGFAQANPIDLSVSYIGSPHIGRYACRKRSGETSETGMISVIENTEDKTNSSTRAASSTESYSVQSSYSADERMEHPVKWPTMDADAYGSGLKSEWNTQSAVVYSKFSTSKMTEPKKTGKPVTTTVTTQTYSSEGQTESGIVQPATRAGQSNVYEELTQENRAPVVTFRSDNPFSPQLPSFDWAYQEPEIEWNPSRSSQTTRATVIQHPNTTPGITRLVSGTINSTDVYEYSDLITPGQIYSGMLTDLSQTKWSDWERVDLAQLHAVSTSSKGDASASGLITKWRLSYELPEGAIAADYSEIIVSVTAEKILPNGEVNEAKEFIKLKPGKDSDVYTCDATDAPGSSLVIKAAIIPIEIDYISRNPQTGLFENLGGVIPESRPTPDVKIQVSDVQLTGSDGLQFTVSSTVSDPLAGVLDGSGPPNAMILVDGEIVETVSLSGGSGGTVPVWQSYPNQHSFSRTITIPRVRAGPHVVRVHTASNAANEVGWDQVTIIVRKSGIPFNGQAPPSFNQPPSAYPGYVPAIISFGGVLSSVNADTISLTQGNTATVTLKEPSSLPSVLEFSGASVDMRASVELEAVPTFDPAHIDVIQATAVITLASGAVARLSGYWAETSVDSKAFTPSSFRYLADTSSAAQLVVDSVQHSTWQHTSSLTPLVVRIRVPESVADVLTEPGGPLSITVGGQHAPVIRDDTFNVGDAPADGRVSFYLAKDNKPQVFAAVEERQGDLLPPGVFQAGGLAVGWKHESSENMPLSEASILEENDPPAGTASGAGGASSSQAYDLAEVMRWLAVLDEMADGKLMHMLAAYQSLGDTEFRVEVTDLWDATDWDGYHIKNTAQRHENAGLPCIIQLDDDFPSPVHAAQALAQAIMEVRSTVWRWNFETLEMGDPIEDYNAMFARMGVALDNTATAAQIGLGLLNEGADWVLTVPEIADSMEDGKHKQAVMLSVAMVTPFLAGVIVKKGIGLKIRGAAGELIELPDEVLEAFAMARTAVKNANSVATSRVEAMKILGPLLQSGQISRELMKDMIDRGFFFVSNSSSRGFLRKALAAENLPNSIAHHDLPIAKRFHENFLLAGLDPNDPAFGRIVNKATHDAWHNGKDVAHGGAFNWVWDEFFQEYSEATAQQILEKLAEIRSGHVYRVPVKNGQTKDFTFN